MQRITSSLLQQAHTVPRTLTRASTLATRSSAVRFFASDEGGFVPKPIYSSFKIYKSKTAVDVAPIRAQLAWNSARVEDRRYLSLKRAGGFRLTFAAGENRSFDWESGEKIALSVPELGDILAFAQNPQANDMKIIHDPSMGGDNAGRVLKELVIKRIGNGKSGYFWNFAVSNKEGNSGAMGTPAPSAPLKWSIAVSEGEMQVFTALIKSSLPSLLALQLKPQVMSNSAEQVQATAGSAQQGTNWSGGARSAKYNKDTQWGEQ